MEFTYDPEYLRHEKHQALSQSLPLQKNAFTNKQCRPFFSGILPEAKLRAAIARHLGISEKNDFALLAALGGECAGAVSILPNATDLQNIKPDYRIIDNKALPQILQTIIQKPMLAGEDGIRLSLAGAQDKLAVALIDGQIAIPMHGAASTHILKPANRDFPFLIENEYFCLKLAQKIGLAVIDASLHNTEDSKYLLVKRYDRITTKQGIQRLHQEDFCQALAIMSEMKYQAEGGPNVSACFHLLRQVSSLPVIDMKTLLQGILFNVIIGNNDAHGKNFSLLYQNQQIRLAPLYDLISTAYYPNLSKKMAMKIGSKYDFDDLFPRHFAQMAEDAQISVTLVQKELKRLLTTIQTEISDSPFTQLILQRIDKLNRRYQA